MLLSYPLYWVWREAMLLGCCCIYLHPLVPCRHDLMSQRRHFFGKRGRHGDEGAYWMGLGLSALLRLFFFIVIVLWVSCMCFILCTVCFCGHCVCHFMVSWIFVCLMYVVFIRRQHCRCKLAKKLCQGAIDVSSCSRHWGFCAWLSVKKRNKSCKIVGRVHLKFTFKSKVIRFISGVWLKPDFSQIPVDICIYLTTAT